MSRCLSCAGFSVRLAAFLRPGLPVIPAPRAALLQEGRRPPRASAARSVLDQREHGAILHPAGTAGPIAPR
jgi:hypothetical protein